MKVNKWTLGLAAVGLVSLPAVIQAEEKQLSPLQTAVASTVISGYVNTAARWNPGTGNGNVPAYIYNERNKQDAFSLDVVDLTIEKPLDEAKWAAGYRVDLWFGQDANVFASQSPISTGTSDFAIRQAYVSLRAPLGNGLDFKMGAFDSVVGYESHDAGKNPNYTRSYGTTIEPHTHTGLLASYQFSDLITAKAGVANTMGPSINENANDPASFGADNRAESYKAYMGAIQLTAPESMGFLAGSTLYGGIVNGLNSDSLDGGVAAQTSYYLGATMATPIKELRLGAAFDWLEIYDGGYAWNLAGYASFQATEKLSLHARTEWLERSGVTEPGLPKQVFELTGTVQYDLWKNVISRLEVRWDHAADGDPAYGGADGETPTLVNSVSIMANVIYMF